MFFASDIFYNMPLSEDLMFSVEPVTLFCYKAQQIFPTCTYGHWSWISKITQLLVQQLLNSDCMTYLFADHVKNFGRTITSSIY